MLARIGLPRFEYCKAQDPDEAVRLLEEHGHRARLIMGGTDLLPAMRHGLLQPRLLIDVKGLSGMRSIEYDRRTGLEVGAAVTMNQLALDPMVKTHYPALAEAAHRVGVLQIRHRATLGGNLSNASPCADTAPVSLIFDATLDLFGPDGKRSVPAANWFLGPGQAAIQPAEFLTGIRFPAPPPKAASTYLKLGRSKAGDLSLVSVAILAYPDKTPSGYRFCIGLGSVAPTPIRAARAEEMLVDSSPGDDSFLQAAQMAKEASNPITDVRATAEYQRDMVRALTHQALRDVWAQVQEED